MTIKIIGTLTFHFETFVEGDSLDAVNFDRIANMDASEICEMAVQEFIHITKAEVLPDDSSN